MNSKTVNIAHITDMHLLSCKNTLFREKNPNQTFNQVIEHIGNSDWKPDALIATGDISNDGAKITYDRAYKKIKELRLPALCIPGNHDDSKNLIKHLPSEFTDRLLIIKNWVLIGLDSSVKSSPEGLLSSGELEKMQHRLQENASKNVIICLHHQPVKIGSDWIDKIGLKNKKDFFRIIKEYNHIKGIFFGHIHQDYYINQNNIRIYGTPSTCRQFMPKEKNFKMDMRPPAYRRIELFEDGTIKTEVVWLDDK